MLHRARLAGPLLAVALAAPAATASLPNSGLYGVVRKGPTRTVCQVGVPCDAPAEVTLVFARGGAEVGRTRSGPDGSYRIRLASGYFTVRTLERLGITRNIRPANVHVRAGHFDKLDFSIDTGIR